jgi:hypothetical protein
LTNPRISEQKEEPCAAEIWIMLYSGVNYFALRVDVKLADDGFNRLIREGVGGNRNYWDSRFCQGCKDNRNLLMDGDWCEDLTLLLLQTPFQPLMYALLIEGIY